MPTKQQLVRGGGLLSALVFALLWTSIAFALPRQPGEGDPPPGGGDPDPGPPTPTCIDQTTGHLASDGLYIGVGGSVTLNWYVSAPSGCSPRVTINGVEKTRGGSMLVEHIQSTSTFTLRASANGQSATFDSVTITVLQGTVDIKGNGPEWRALLVGALGVDGLTVRLAENVDMDMSGLNDIYIRKGVKLIAGQPCQLTNAPPWLGLVAFDPSDLRPLCGMRGVDKPGPRLYTTTKPNPLFHIRCLGGFEGDNVQISGFRIQGPHWGSMDGDDNLEQGIRIESCNGVDIGNMEFSGWSGTAIYVIDKPDAPLQPAQHTPDAVKIHDSFIHHNQHNGGNGYGVAVNDGAQVTVERNAFDYNRHAIKGGSGPGTVYKAINNLVLVGGGVHGGIFNAYTHQFDVHGSENCGPDVPGNQHTWNCGDAGQQFTYTGNAFQYTRDLDIKVRGRPSIGSTLERNIFAHTSEDDAFDIGGGSALINNTFGRQSYGRYHVCDFTGDGKDDLFLATGATWWVNSGGKSHWWLLNVMPERYDQVLVGDFNGDKRCDVFTVNGADWLMSSGGTEPWQRIVAGANVPLDQLRVGDFNGDGRSDFFRRAPDGQWFIVSPGVFPMTPVASSGFALDKLRFGDFNGDRVTDVMATVTGRWQVSWGARSAWEPINTLSDEAVFVANLDAVGSDDVIKWSDSDGKWRISKEGRGPWIVFAESFDPYIYFGRFTGFSSQDLLIMPFWTRGPGQLLQKNLGSLPPSAIFKPYATYEY
jgi:hypothetical protein